MSGKLKYKDIEPVFLEFLRENGKDLTAKEMASLFNYPEPAMWSIIRRYKIEYKRIRDCRKGAAKSTHDSRYAPDPVTKIARVRGEYSNTTPYGIASAYLNGK